MPRKVFIAYDFEIKGDLTLNLEAVARKPGAGLEVKWPGAPEGRTQGAIWKDVVEPNIGWCDRLLAFADLPNANGGFELGYALARGREVAIARTRKEVPSWLDRAPMNGLLCHRAETIGSICKLLEAEDWVKPPEAVPSGDGVLALCPPGSAAATVIDDSWEWRHPEKHGWDLNDIPGWFEGIGRVVWIISSHSEGPEGRDGSENSALAILAGYALGRNLVLDVFYHTNARKVVDVAARHEPFSDLGKLRTLLESVADEHKKSVSAKQAAAPTLEQQAILTAEAARPKDLTPLPEDGWDVLQLPRFIGRDRELTDAMAAVKAVAAGEASAARVWWIHGFGGMGKSWFLRRLAVDAIETQPDLGVLLVDWDPGVWREPLKGEPATPADVYRAIAWRLAQVRGVAAADPYWLAQARVEAASESHRALESHFDGLLMTASQGQRIETALLDQLKNERLVDAEGKLRGASFEKWRLDRIRRERVFEAWAGKAASCPLGPDPKAAITPNDVLRDGLAGALRSASSTAPLLVLLDTCEVLTEELDHALRSLVAGLVRDHSRVIFLIGSRLIPDVAQPSGSREGWRADLQRVDLREVPFSENVRFTVKEIESALKRLKRPAPEVPSLAERLHALTYGVPFALRGFFDIHETEEGSEILAELANGEEQSLGEEEAMRRVTQLVADRMLYHLANRLDREEDLKDIIALALLPRADSAILALLWPAGVRPRLRELSTRYSLLGGGDLHPTVRRYLRRHWRGEDRPMVFSRVLGHIEGIAESLEPPEPDGVAAVIERRLLHVTLASWRRGGDCADALARGLAIALAYDEGCAPMLELLRELAESPVQVIANRGGLPKGNEWEGVSFEYGGKPKLIRWLCETPDRSTRWTAEESACASLLKGILSGVPESNEKAKTQIGLLLDAVTHFSAEATPQKRQVVDGLWSAALYLQDEKRLGENPEMVPLIERAYLAAISLTPSQAALHNNLGNLYKTNLERPEDAERAYLKAVELDPNYATPHYNLGILYADNLGRREEAERAYLKAIELDPKYAYPHNGLGNLYKGKLERPEDAERAYLKAIELDPKFATPHHNLGILYADNLGRPEEAERAYLRAIELDPNYASPHNGLGNLYKDKLERPEEAERAYLKAVELDPKYAYPHHNLGQLYHHNLGRPEEAERAYLKAIELDPKYAYPHNGLGNLYKDKLKRPEDAELAYLKAIELDPKFAYPHHNLGQLYHHNLGRPEEAERAYLRAIELDPKYASSHNGLGNLYKDKLERPEDAELAYFKAIELDPKFAYPHHNLGQLYHYNLGRPEEAERAYLRAIELDPKYASPHNGLGNLYKGKLERPEDAERAYFKAIELNPKSSSTHHSLADLYQNWLFRPEDAEREYRKSLEIDATNIAAHQSLAFLYLANLGDPTRAREELRQCMAVAPDVFGTRLCACAMVLWDDGWGSIRHMLPDVLAAAEKSDPDNWRGELRFFIRKVRDLDGLAGLVSVLSEAAKAQSSWEPWTEAVAALNDRTTEPQWRHPEAEMIFIFLNAR